MIEALVSTPSVSSSDASLDQGNVAVIEQLASWLTDRGFSVEVMPLPGDSSKANLIATLGSGSGGLVLSGHTDTVPWDEGKWQHDPFSLTQADQRLYGLGTSDMKAFLALAIEASRELRAGDLKEPLIILATADEETSMAGAKALVERGLPRARHAVIGEPTGLRPVHMHKGIMMEAIHLQGRSGHSSDPALGNSALEAMYSVIGALREWRNELQQKHHDARFAVPVPTLNLIDLRPLPGMDLQQLREELRHRIIAVLDDSGIQASFKVLFEGVPAMETPVSAGIVQLAEKLTGHSAEAVAFATEAPYLNQLGMQTVVLGPGDIDQAHQPDEYLALDRLTPTIEILKQMIDTICIRRDPLL